MIFQKFDSVTDLLIFLKNNWEFGLRGAVIGGLVAVITCIIIKKNKK